MSEQQETAVVMPGSQFGGFIPPVQPQDTPAMEETPVDQPPVDAAPVDGGQQETHESTPSDQPPAEGTTPKADPFYERLKKEFGADVSDDDSFTKWKEEFTKPKQVEYKNDAVKSIAEIFETAADENEAIQAVNAWAFLNTTDWAGKAATPEGQAEILRVGIQLDNPGMDGVALDFKMRREMEQYSMTDEQLEAMYPGEDVNAARAYHQSLLAERVKNTLNKINGLRVSFKPSRRDNPFDPTVVAGGYTEAAKKELSSLKFGEGDISYNFSAKDIDELSSPKAVEGFLSRLAPNGKFDHAYAAKVLAVERFLSGGGLKQLLDKSNGAGQKKILNTIENAHNGAPARADQPNTVVVKPGEWRGGA